MKNKQKWLSASILLLTALLCVLRSICMMNDYIPKLGYFDTSALVITTKILFSVTIALCFTAPFLNDKQQEVACPATTGHTVFSMFAGFLMIISGIGAILNATNTKPITLLLGLFTIAGSVFFFTEPLSSRKAERPRAYFSFSVLALLFCILFHIYFDMYVAINSPLKISLQLCLLGSMIYSLALIRRAIGKPASRIDVGAELACAALCLPTSVSHLIYAMFGNPSILMQNVLSPFVSLPLFALGAFTASRVIFKK